MRCHGPLPTAAEHRVETSERNAGDAVGDHLGAVLVGRPAARLGPAGEVADGAATVGGDEKAE